MASDGVTAFGVDDITGDQAVLRLALVSDGIVEQERIPGRIGEGTIYLAYDEDLIFLSSGARLTTSRLSRAGTGTSAGFPIPDQRRGRVHHIQDSTVYTHHAGAGPRLGSTQLGNLVLTRGARFGVDGLAVGGGDGLLLLRSPLFGHP